MATTTLIDPTTIPTTRSRGVDLRAEATDHLRDALRANQALTIRLADGERSQCYILNYRAAAADLGISLRITRDGQRPMRTRDGRSWTDAETIYIRFVKQSNKTPALRPISAGADRREFEPITRAEISR